VGQHEVNLGFWSVVSINTLFHICSKDATGLLALLRFDARPCHRCWDKYVGDE
jgi:hypothetical protein